MIKWVSSGGSADVFNLASVEMEVDLNKRGKNPYVQLTGRTKPESISRL